MHCTLNLCGATGCGGTQRATITFGGMGRKLLPALKHASMDYIEGWNEDERKNAMKQLWIALQYPLGMLTRTVHHIPRPCQAHYGRQAQTV